MEDNIIISDENLNQFYQKEILEDMASLFSKSCFDELLKKYFYVIKKVELKNNTTDKIEEHISLNNNNELININNDIEPIEIELNYKIFEKLMLNNEYCHQILLTIVIFCILKNKKRIKDTNLLFERYNYPINDMIFPLAFLKIKYYIISDQIPKAIDNINILINNYEEYNINIEQKKKDIKNIYTIETYHQKFIYFNNLFNYFFNMNDINSKIKKLYFELKSCFYQMQSFTQAYQTILNLYHKYPDDIIIQFELAKESIKYSKPDIYQKILKKLKENKDKEKNEFIKNIYINYILYAEALGQIAYNNYTEAKKKFEEILELKKDKDNLILNNNIAVLNIYEINLKEGYDKLIEINKNKKIENINNNIELIQEKFGKK